MFVMGLPFLECDSAETESSDIDSIAHVGTLSH